MRIGELAKASGVSTSRIRFYEEHGVLPEAARRDNGYRDYAPSTVAVLRFIDGAQALGFTLAELRAALTTSASDVPAAGDMIGGLERKHAELGRHIKAASAKRGRIAALIAELRICDAPGD
jgi:MerR family transcriptional regulator, copper efflux regulator